MPAVPASRESLSLRTVPAREPADQPTKHRPDLGCERNVGGHADDDSEAQPNNRTNHGRGSDRHASQMIHRLPPQPGGFEGFVAIRKKLKGGQPFLGRAHRGLPHGIGWGSATPEKEVPTLGDPTRRLTQATRWVSGPPESRRPGVPLTLRCVLGGTMRHGFG
jgi:hypothetical protein